MVPGGQVVPHLRNRIGNGVRRAHFNWVGPRWASQLPAGVTGPGTGTGGPSVPLFWWRPFSFTNFGDELSWLLVGRLSGRPVAWRSPRSTCLIGMGSLMEMVARQPPDRLGGATRTIWGTGCMYDRPLAALPRARCVAVRGELTLAKLPRSLAAGVTALGDPGLLTSRVFPFPPHRGPDRAPLLVAHFLDAGAPELQQLCRAIPGLRLVSPTADPLAVAAAIAGAEYVITSALHPLVIAEAYDVPAIWVQLSQRVQGGRFKFDDFYSALGTKRTPVPVASVLAARGGAAELAVSLAGRATVTALQEGLLSTLASAIGGPGPGRAQQEGPRFLTRC